MKITCLIHQNETMYDIEIEDKSLLGQKEYISTLGSRCVIVTDDRVESLYGQELRQSLNCSLLSFPHGERSKTRKTKEDLENCLLEMGMGRDLVIVALGGGVVTDMAGFLASTYFRGVPLVMMPTSLLAMVDASIGGKNGVNVEQGKNLIGSIYQPKKVVIDPTVLCTLPEKELRQGIVEMIKHGLIANSSYYTFLEEHMESLCSKNLALLKPAILQSCLIKKEVVEEDEKEEGRRAILNLGHTIGHALEKVSNHVITHGEAVAWGILIEGALSVGLNLLSKRSFDRIRALFKKSNLLVPLMQDISKEELIRVMHMDKKAVSGTIRFVALSEIGRPLVRPISDDLLRGILDEVDDVVLLS